MVMCYFCALESEELKECPKCLQQYCPIHFDTYNHDCPLIPIQNPYDIIVEEEYLSENTDNLSQLSNNEYVPDAEIQNEKIQEQQDKNIEEIKIDEDEDTLESIESLEIEKSKPKILTDADFDEENDDENNDDKALNDNDDDYDEIEVDLEDVFDIKHEHEDPDGYLQPDQMIKAKAPILKQVKVVQNRVKNCCYCDKPVEDLVTQQFIEIRNVQESLIKSIRRGKFGGEVDGFWICGEPECLLKWKSREPVYINFGKEKTYRYRRKIN